ncbi:vegetative cell wall protein gp1-like [Capsicum annuum]|uniref:vegetative cell wall protein gp1-like n=1 Tax=Capsicum annuum TaxID=4072 RepID=UPI001FB10705|nr:vegetative cell wall protein gp1-like [Capsicum annuum]
MEPLTALSLPSPSLSLTPHPGPRPSAPSPTIGADPTRPPVPGVEPSSPAERLSLSPYPLSLPRPGLRPHRRRRPTALTRPDPRSRPPVTDADPHCRTPVPRPPTVPPPPPFSVQTPTPTPIPPSPTPVQQSNSRSSVFYHNRRSIDSSRRSISAAKSPGSKSTQGLVAGLVYKRNLFMVPSIPDDYGEVFLIRYDVPKTIIDVDVEGFLAQQLKVEHHNESEDESEDVYEEEYEEEFEDEPKDDVDFEDEP